jgi:hypothetical protein
VVPFALELEHDDFAGEPCTCITLVGFVVGISIRFTQPRFAALVGFMQRSLRKDLRDSRQTFALIAEGIVITPAPKGKTA